MNTLIQDASRGSGKNEQCTIIHGQVLKKHRPRVQVIASDLGVCVRASLRSLILSPLTFMRAFYCHSLHYSSAFHVIGFRNTKHSLIFHAIENKFLLCFLTKMGTEAVLNVMNTDC